MSRKLGLARSRRTFSRRRRNLSTRRAKWPSGGTSWERKTRPEHSSRRAFDWGKRTPRFEATFAARLARFDLPAALAIAREFPVSDAITHTRLTGTSPSAWPRRIPPKPSACSDWFPTRTGKRSGFLPQSPGKWPRPIRREPAGWSTRPSAMTTTRRLYLFLALGLKTRDPAAAEQAFWKAIEGIDRLMKEGAEYSAMRGHPWCLAAAGRADRPDAWCPSSSGEPSLLGRRSAIRATLLR